MGFKNNCLSFIKCSWAAYLVIFLLIAGCAQDKAHFKSPPGYNISKPYIIQLPSELDEISGITYYQKDNSLFAESDAKGCLYKIFLNKPTDIRKWKFSHKKDYEDIVLHDSTFYVLNNNGNIVALSFLNDSLVSHDYTFPENGNYEFETIFYDDQLQKLVLICKDCEIDKKTTTTAYTFDPGQLVYNSGFTIDVKKIEEIIGPTSSRFKPSAASINPVTKELYILSSVNKLLVIADRTGAIKNVYKLDPGLFGQPEGIAFSPNGGMFISNEAGKTSSANILYYQLNKNNTE